ncbi:3-deoxy-7-phosphoheptulonate synthase class II [Calditerrivibrio nitroreducens]|uniref:Phospho-2-dehydro-3-deoxyheptonate aldolase n=1 Tax=Calditerrivibrio nitroreducens (strain DSM 19672 / NBRC 101217 / Yu37-1) TaxID=768670 RepID=E4TGE5_CALNY|nr:3-deoxy-7-phosphoheptulonate synthase class II [Calditerrivibrio nitroreducens]ADR18626.1 3-deoxy-7-phosphoheptulonate synthase [Calditerrivibrio nitroreducens DSM 19672]
MSKKIEQLTEWRSYKIKQQPVWYNKELAINVLSQIAKLPALVFAGETRNLKNNLIDVEQGRTILLQCGDCSENFDYCHGPRIHNMLRIIFQMALIISFKTKKKVLKIGRIAGQYAKPRSNDYEIINGVKLPVYRGDIINGYEPTLDSRKHDPERMLKAYFYSAATLNLIRAFTQGGYASLEYMLDWQRHFFSNSKIMYYYVDLVREIENNIRFIRSLGINTNEKVSSLMEFFISHEGLLLEYEEKLCRIDTLTYDLYSTSAHMLWIGNRTREPEGAHAYFMSNINNPVGIKIGPGYDVNEINKLLCKLNPNNHRGKIVLITRFGYDKIEKEIIPLIEMIKNDKLNLSIICDPVHGNTETINNIKIRRFENIVKETELFFKILTDYKLYPGGVHLEMTSDNVTECLGGLSGISENDLNLNYTTYCDPRLNADQAVEYAFKLAEIINETSNNL